MVVSNPSSAKHRLVGSILLIGALILSSGAAPPSGATHAPLVDEFLAYDFSLPVPEDPMCDENATFAVRFCETLKDDYNRARIVIVDLNLNPIPVGAKYEFRTTEGALIDEDVFCGEANIRVPESADELFVDLANVESYLDDRHQFGFCALAPLEGEVWLRWTHGVSASPEPPQEEDPTKKCTCECTCDPIFGCECECTAVDGDHECNECEHDE